MAGAGSAMAQKGSGGGGGNQTTAAFSPSLLPLLYSSVASSTVVNLTLFNVGSAPLTIGTITIGGAAAADYSSSGTCANGAVLQRTPGANSCALQITFAPKAIGSRPATLNATFLNAPALTVRLDGTGLFPGPQFVLGLAGNSIDFGSTPLGTIPNLLSGQGLSISNPGGKTLIGSMAFVGANPGDFVIGSAGSRTFNCPPNLALGPPPAVTACQLGINFVPTALGVRTATLRLTTNDPANAVVDVALSGVATPAVVQPPPPIASVADFTDLWVNATEAAWSLGITHHKFTTDVLVAFWHTYDVDGRDAWFELRDGHWVDGVTYTGILHQPLGPAFSNPYDPALVVDVVVGTATLSFADGSNGTFAYSINGITGSKAITRAAF
jgi:hypothetical protein